MVAGKGSYSQLWCPQGCPIHGVGRQLFFSPMEPVCRSHFGLQIQPVRDGCSNPACKGQPADIALMGKGMFSCHHPFMPASYARTHGRSEPEICLYAFHGRYRLPLHHYPLPGMAGLELQCCSGEYQGCQDVEKKWETRA